MFYLLILAITLVLTLSSLPMIINLSHRKGWLDYPTQRKMHKLPTPRLGGISIFIACLIAWTAGIVLKPETISGLEDLVFWLFLGGVFIFCLGLWDDLRPVRFRYKILIEALAGVVLILAGLKIELLFIPFWQPTELGWLSYPVTLIWFLALLNSINLIDGLDGLAGGVSVIAGATMFVIGLHYQAWLVALLMCGVVAACVGFLLFNRPPAKIFMGDSGSLFLGYLFAISSLICPIKSYTALAMFVPLVALALPLLEAVTSFLRRTLSLKKFYVPDNQHLYNLLLDLGFSPKNTILTFYLISGLFSLLSLLLMFKGRILIMPIFILFIVLASAVTVYTYILGVRMKAREKRVAL
jgi:UDP-GlcNAc:undecaprenyl-phosphate GlcNAc-1-phosphate transferase